MKFKIGQVYTFNDSETVDIINHFERTETGELKIWYQIWQIKDLTYFDEEKKEYIVWSKAMPNNEGTCIDLEYLTEDDWEAVAFACNDGYKYLGMVNKDWVLNKHFRLVKKENLKGKWYKWKPKR